MHIQGVIFDLDGTLADTLPVCIQAFQRVLLEFTGKAYSPEEVRATFGPSEEGVFHSLVPAAPGAALRQYLQAYEELHCQCPAPFPGISTALEMLTGRGIKLAIVTGKGPGSAAISMRCLGLSSYFPILEAGSESGPNKPACISKVLEIWDLDPSRVAYVGDHPSDMRAAAATGVVGIGAAWADTATVLGADVPAHVVFTSVEAFFRWIQEATAEGPVTP